MLKLWPLFFLLSTPFILSAAEWNFKNNPFFNASKILETKIDLLPQSFELSKLIVTDWYWPLSEGGILNRWAQKNPKKPTDKFYFDFFPQENLKNVDISQLSPPEKFDLFLGNSNWEFSRFIKKSQASLLDSDLKSQLAFGETILKFKNPTPLVLEGKSSLKIPFGSSDIRALLFAFTLLGTESTTKIVGNPCKFPFIETDIKKIQPILDECEGINPGSFHLILSNYLGLRGEGIILDLKRNKKLEIRPVVGYVSNFQEIEGPLSANASKKAKKEILVTTFLKFIIPRQPRWSPEPSATSRGYESFTYTLELDKENNIIGGTWISFNRPDFLAINQAIKFSGDFKELEFIYKKSIDSTDEKLKLKIFTQKELIKGMISKNKPQEILNLMFDEYFNSYKNQLTQKRSEKKIARSKLSRELILTQQQLRKKIQLIPINKSLKNLSMKFIDLAEKNTGVDDLYKIQLSFLDTARKNYSKIDLTNAGRIAYLQQKYLDDFFDLKKINYDRIDYIQKSFLMESELFSQKEILTSNPVFLEKINLFFKGIRQEKDNLKTNPLGELRIKNLIPQIKSTSPSLLVSSFIDDVKKDLKKTKLANNNYWKRFLTEKKSTSWSKITMPNISEEIKKFNLPKNYNNLGRMYRLSFSIKRIQALKKVQIIPTFNLPKEKTEYYQSKFQEELGLIKYKDFFKPISNFESISLYDSQPFKNSVLQKESSNLLEQAKKEVTQFIKDGNRLSSAIKESNSKIIDELLKNNLLLNFESDNHLNPLLTAVSEGNKEALSKILSEDIEVSINYEDQMGKNALSLGIIKNLDPELLKSLVFKGIDFNAKDSVGLYPRDYLKRANSFDQFLESMGAKLSQNNPN